MVVDIRYLLAHKGDERPKVDCDNQGENIEEWLDQCVKADAGVDFEEALSNLRHSVPNKAGIELLFKLAADSSDQRQLLAVQTLGYHRSWRSTSSFVRRLLELARDSDADPKVIAALVWSLRQREEVAEFLAHPDSSVVREAALGVPVGRRTIRPILTAIRLASWFEVNRILMFKLRQMHPSLMPYIVEILKEESWEEDTLRDLFAVLPQTSVFELLIDGRQVSQGTMSDSQYARRWQKTVRVAIDVLTSDPESELLFHLFRCSGNDGTFARRHSSFIRAAVTSAAVFSEPHMVGFLERLTSGASEDKVARLAETLVTLSTRLDGHMAEKVRGILEEWKSRSADLKLKIYHLEQGLS